MGVKDQYTIWSRPESDKTANLYRVAKFDEDLNFLEEYNLTELPGGAMICNCPAGGRPTCRHRKMLRIFQAQKRIDSGWFLNFDKDTWTRPIKPAGEDSNDSNDTK